ncbi:hypothetical protein ACFWA9_27375 [Kitasatospora sp. NPDC059973]|uniref:hypothetical protein n=1 Tax=Kitasatospora sp. NPDC059973 TaxID=3347020 RepID=UPI00367DF307
MRTAHSARDKEDLVLLLTALGLPSGEDDLARLAPQLATQAGTAGRPDQPHGGTPVSDTLTTTDEQAHILAAVDPVTREVALVMR